MPRVEARFVKAFRRRQTWLAATVLLAALTCPLPTAAQTRSENELARVLREMYSEDFGEVRYFLKYFDLDGDGTPEAIVHVVGPHVCGTGGCDTYVFARRGGGYKLVSTIGLSRPLIVASSHRSHGWRDLIVFIAGGGILPGHYAELRFDGKSYPENPTVAPARKVRGKPRGTVLIGDFKVYTQGRLLVPARRKGDRSQ